MTKMIEVEIKSEDPFLLNMVLDVAEEYGGIVNGRPYLVSLGYCSVQIPWDNVDGTMFEKIKNTKVGMIKV